MPKDLKASVTLETKSAEARLKALVKAINRVQNAVSKTSKNNAQLTKAINGNVSATNKLRTAATNVATSIAKQTTAQNKVTQAVKQTTNAQRESGNAVDGLISKVKQLAKTYLGVMGMRAMIESADTLTGAQNQLNNLDGGSPSQTNDVLDKVYAASVRSRGDYATMMKNVGKSMTLSPDAFKGNMDNAIKFQEVMAKAYKLSGASAAEQASSMYQIIQALGSGVLQGDELRSVTEGASMAAKQIEKFAQSVYGTTKSLKEMGSEGMLTSELVVAAILDGEKEIQNAFDKTKMTFGDAWTRIKNDAIKAFEPVFVELTNLLNKFADSGGFEKIGNAFVQIANAVQIALQAIQTAYNWVVENWDWLQYFVVTGLILIISVMVGLKIAAIAASVAMAISFILANAALISVLLLIGSIIAALWSVAKNSQSVTDFIAQAALYLAKLIIAALLIIAVIALATGQWIVSAAVLTVMVIIGIILSLVYAFFTCTEEIVGAVYAAGAIIWNIVAAAVNSTIQFLWSNFVVPWIGIVEWVLNVFNGGFDSFADAVANLLSQLISYFIEFGKVATKIIDAVFGTNWTASLSNLSSKLAARGKNEKAITLNKNAPWTMSRKNVGEAYNAGTIAGGNLKTSINNWGKNFSVSGLFDKFKINKSGLPSADYGKTTGTGGYDPSSLLDGIKDNTGSTAGSAGKIADTMELAEEDLAYLKDIANMEWKKEFTTANIRVDMNNSGATINNQGDLDGIVTKLTTALYEELDAVAHGVYA